MLQDLIHEYLQQDRGNEISLTIPIHEDKRDVKKFRMSDAGKCRLMRYWKRQGKEMTPPGVEARRNMELGNVLHAWVIQALSDVGALESAEIELEDEHRIGHYDVIVSKGSRRILYDLKTVNGKQWYWKVDKRKGPDTHQVFQLVTYASVMSVDECSIAYVHRESLQIEEFPVSQAQFLEIVNDDWKILIDAWNDQREPAINTEPWECKYCPYNLSCSYASF